MIVIENGRFFDGTGAPSAIRHVAIEGDRVRAISDTPIPGDARRIDAAGKWVVPGFLDTHTHYDAELLAAPGLRESVRHGVTTVCIGSCSLSTVLSEPEDCADMFSRVEALPREHVLAALRRHQTWRRPADYIDALEARPLGPNVAAFLGHSDLRTSVMGLGRAVDPDARPTRAELNTMRERLHEALDAGFMGMSSMTNPWDKVGGTRFRSSKLPSTYATWGEYRALHRVLRERGRILQSAPNITTKLNVLLFMAETIGAWVRRPLRTTLITAADAKSSPGLARLVTWATGALNRLLNGDLRWQTVPMPFEVYADGMDLVVFEEFGAGEAALHLADALERNALLSDETYRRRFRKDYEKRWSPRVWHRDFYDAEIVGCPDASVVGMSFGEVGDARGLHPVDAFLDLVVAHGTRLRWRTTIANHRNDVLERIVSHPSVQVSFADSGAHVRNMAFYNFPLYFLRMVQRAAARGEPMMTTERAVHRLTGELAAWHGLDAGVLAVGRRADIAVIDPAGLDDSLDDIHEAPMEAMGGLMRMVRRNDAAVAATLIAGRVVYESGAGFPSWYGERARTGSFLRAGARATAATTPLPHTVREASESGAGNACPSRRAR